MKYLVQLMLAVIVSTIVLSFFATTSVFAKDTHYSKEYLKQHDGGDRAKYLQELEEQDDPAFYVPPVNDTSIPVSGNTSLLTADSQLK